MLYICTGSCLIDPTVMIMIVPVLYRSYTRRKWDLHSNPQSADLKTLFILTPSSPPEHLLVTESHTHTCTVVNAPWLNRNLIRNHCKVSFFSRFSWHSSQCKHTPVVSRVQLCCDESKSGDVCGYSCSVSSGGEHQPNSRGTTYSGWMDVHIS